MLPLLVFSNECEDNTISIKSTLDTYAKAEKFIFTIKLMTENKNPEKVFKEHAIIESKLDSIINAFNIPDSLVQRTMTNIRNQNSANTVSSFQTIQYVTITDYDLDQYDDMQVSLLTNAFSDYKSGYSIDNLLKAKEKGYIAAFKDAKETALAIAKSMGKELGDVLNISTNIYDTIGTISTNLPSGIASEDLTQTVKIRVNIEVSFKIK